MDRINSFLGKTEDEKPDDFAVYPELPEVNVDQWGPAWRDICSEKVSITDKPMISPEYSPPGQDREDDSSFEQRNALTPLVHNRNVLVTIDEATE